MALVRRAALLLSMGLAWLLISGPLASAQGLYQWERLAGTAGGGGYLDELGAEARFYGPSSVALDADGNVYVADKGNDCIRKMSPDGDVTTFAGLGGSRGNANGAGANARFSAPAGLAMDADGNLYVADTGNQSIRKISSAGMVTTLAGNLVDAGSANGSGSAARFKAPTGVAVDATGTVYVADTGNHIIRKITRAGVVTTLAGKAGISGSVNGSATAARFSSPAGLAVDGGGNVFVADTNNQLIRKITPAGVVSTVAGTPGASGSDDGFGADARFAFPAAVSLDATGTLYVADQGNNVIRQITSDGEVTTWAGDSAMAGSADGLGADAQFNAPAGIAIAPDGTLFVADTANHTLRSIDTDALVSTVAGAPALTGSDDGLGDDARFFRPRGVALDSAGSVYVADSSNSLVRKITVDGEVTTLAGSPGAMGSADGDSSAARFGSPQGIAMDAAGNLFVADTSNHNIRKIDALGMVSTLAGLAGASGSTDGAGSAARFSQPGALALDMAGNLYVADTGNHTVRKVSPQGAVTTLAGKAGVAGSADGSASAARFNQPVGVAVDAGGIVFVADRGNHLIRRITPEGAVSTLVLTEAGAAASLPSLAGIAAGRNGHLFVTENDTATVRKISSAGVVSTVGGRPFYRGAQPGLGDASRFEAPRGVAVSADGRLIVANADAILQGTPLPVISVEAPAGTVLVSGVGGIDFGTLEVGGAPGARTVSIRNLGDGDLNLDSVSVDGDGALSLGTPLGSTQLAPGETTTFSVLFTALSVGDFSATVTLESDDADQGTFVIALSAHGKDTTAPVILGVPGTLTTKATGPNGAVVIYPMPTATDALGVVSLTALPASGSTFPIGQTTVHVTARDAAGNESTASFLVIVNEAGNSQLASLSMNLATIRPAFDPAVTSYSATIANRENTGIFLATSLGGGSIAQSPANPVPLAVGLNVVKFKVTSIDGQHTTTYSLNLTRTVPDAVPPVIKLLTPAGASVGDTFDLSGTLNEAVGLSSLSVFVNGIEQPLDTPLSGSAGAALPWTVSAIAAENGPNAILVVAKDFNGNSSSSTKTVTYLNRRPELAGTFSALLKPAGTPGQIFTGLVRLTVTKTGAFTGKANFGGQMVPLSGVLANDGTARFKPDYSTFPPVLPNTLFERTKGARLSVQVSEADGLLGALFGGLASDIVEASFSAQPSVKKVPAGYLNSPAAKPGKGVYTVILPSQAQSDLTADLFPYGNGAFTLVLKSSGAVTMAGTLADGTKLSVSGKLAVDGSLALYAPLYAKAGSLSAELFFDEDPEINPDTDVFAADALWIRPPISHSLFFPTGWPAGVILNLVGAKYDASLKPNVLPGVFDDDLTDLGNATLSLAQNLDDAQSFYLDTALNLGVLQRNKVSYLAGASLSLHLSPATGLFGGKVPGDGGSTLSFQGVILQKGANGFGSGWYQRILPKGVTAPVDSGLIFLQAN